MSDVQRRLDAALAAVVASSRRVVAEDERPGAVVWLSHLEEVAVLLEQAGADPAAESVEATSNEDESSTWTALVEAAAGELDALEVAERTPAMGPARAELAAVLLSAAR